MDPLTYHRQIGLHSNCDLLEYLSRFAAVDARTALIYTKRGESATEKASYEMKRLFHRRNKGRAYDRKNNRVLISPRRPTSVRMSDLSRVSSTAVTFCVYLAQ